MSKKTLTVFIPLVMLLFASLACNALSGGAATGFQATANAAFTQAAAGAATAGVQGNSALATANAAATELVATANAATSGNGGDVTATPASGQPTAAATASGNGGGGTTADGGPTDIPLVTGTNNVLVASAQLVSYQTSADLATTIKFYKDNMPTNGWTADTKLSVETPTATVLAFTKDTRTSSISIATDPTSKKTVVVITVS